MVRPRNATNVEAITTGFSTGAASMNVTAAEGIRPRCISRRATGTEPHSQIGNASPASAAAGSCSGRGRSPSFSNTPIGTNTSTSAAASAPSSTNGSAWISSEPKITKNVRTQAIRPGSPTLTTSATATSIAADGDHRASVGRARELRDPARLGDLGHRALLV